MRLQRHPDSEGGEGFGVEADAARAPGGRLVLAYRVTGDPTGLRLPPPGDGERADELWRHTCFEAFVRGGGDSYYELNFAPSTRWAAYRLEAYRAGMAPAEGVPRPRITAREDAGSYGLTAEVRLDGLPDLPHAAPWRLGLSAVLEDTAGRMSYWALAHAPGKPDFHHPDSFALDLTDA